MDIPRISKHILSTADFQSRYFKTALPVIICEATDDWPCRKWTIESLVEKVGTNKVFVRGKTNQEEYRVGKRYTIREETFAIYCQNLQAENATAKSSYLAVASMQQAFPQLLSDVPLPDYLTVNGKLHLGPYMWVALKGHYEFCHFDPDDNFLIMIQGRKRVRLYGHDLDSLYPNPLGSHGKTIQSQVNCSHPNLEQCPKFKNAKCFECVLQPGEMLFIPAFFWHQVTALDSGISINMFYGDGGQNDFIEKILSPPYLPHFRHWLLNIVEQNKHYQSFPRMLARLPEVLYQFCIKQWHEECNDNQINRLVDLVKEYLKLDVLPAVSDSAKFPPVMKIRGLLHRDDTKLALN